MINFDNYSPFLNSQVFFSQKDKKKVEKMIQSNQPIEIISTVCPDYANDGKKYTFWGEIGEGVSFTMQQHWAVVPTFLKALGVPYTWIVLVADLTNATEIQHEFLKMVAGSKEEYLRRCEKSVQAIQKMIGDQGRVESFSTFYKSHNIPYLSIQEKTAHRVLDKSTDPNYSAKFESFLVARAPLSEKLWGKKLSYEEQRVAAAYGTSLYATHGTLLRHLYKDKNFIFVNHHTVNLTNLFSCRFVEGYEYLQDMPKFPVGLVPGTFY